MADSSDDWQKKYDTLLNQFNEYRQKIVIQKQAELRQFQKYKCHLDKTYKQFQKKYETKLQQQRVAYHKKIQKLQNTYKAKQEDLHGLIGNKNKFTEELKKRLIESDRQKHQIIEQNTRMLYQLSEGIEASDQILGPHKNSYQQLMRLYQFVLEQNNALKKQLYKVELRHKTQTSSQYESSRINTSMKVQGPMKQQKQRRKKKTANSSADNSKQHNESIRPKTYALAAGKKQTVKKS